MNNFNKLTDEQKLAQVKAFISTMPKAEQEAAVRACVVRKEDQDKMIKELAA